MTRDDHGATTTPSSRRNIASKVGCPTGAAGKGPLGDGLVTRLIPGITTEWIVLDDGTRVTPRHRYLRPDGSFMAIADIVASDGRVVDTHGRVTRLSGTANDNDAVRNVRDAPPPHACTGASVPAWHRSRIDNRRAIAAASNDNAAAHQTRFVRGGRF